MEAVTETVTRNEMTDSDGSEAVTKVMTGGGFDGCSDGGCGGMPVLATSAAIPPCSFAAEVTAICQC